MFATGLPFPWLTRVANRCSTAPPLHCRPGSKLKHICEFQAGHECESESSFASRPCTPELHAYASSRADGSVSVPPFMLTMAVALKRLLNWIRVVSQSLRENWRLSMHARMAPFAPLYWAPTLSTGSDRSASRGTCTASFVQQPCPSVVVLPSPVECWTTPTDKSVLEFVTCQL